MRKSIGIAVTALLVIAAFGILPASATPLMDDWNNIVPDFANSIRFSTYEINWTLDYDGINALHISYDPVNAPAGDINESGNLAGTFYVTDTGGRKFQDDIVLLAAVNSTNEEISIKLNCSGYQWDLTGEGFAPPQDDVDFNYSALNGSFSNSDYAKNGDEDDVFQNWKPGVHGIGDVGDYPIFDGSSDNCYLLFVESNVGTFNNGTSLLNNGSVRVDYSISGLDSDETVVFNAYAWNNMTRKTNGALKFDNPGIRWTNNVTGTTESSVWRVTAP